MSSTHATVTTAMRGPAFSKRWLSAVSSSTVASRTVTFTYLVAGVPRMDALVEVALSLLLEPRGLPTVGVHVFGHEDGPGRRIGIVERIELLPGGEGRGVLGPEPALVVQSQRRVTSHLRRHPAVEGDDVVETILARQRHFSCDSTLVRDAR